MFHGACFVIFATLTGSPPMTTPVVRFAPSPTGKLHVGNVRTALINWLFARRLGGKFILRIDDTDLERSTKAYEDGLKADLAWLGLVWADTFNQSSHFADYAAAADRLRADGLLYACYETAEELDRKRKLALARHRPPVYDRAALSLTAADHAALRAAGRAPHWRFKLSGNRAEWTDLVRGPQSIDTASLSDPILIREDGSFLYTLPSVVDDIRAGITHIVRGEDHVTNSGAQIEIFRALNATSPELAHLALLVGADGQALSKRLGSLSMDELRDQGIEPLAIASLLCKIGTSDNVEARLSLGELAETFDFARIGRAPARFDETELRALNAAILAQTPFEQVAGRIAAIDPRAASAPFWHAVRTNCAALAEVKTWADVIFGAPTPLVAAEDQDFIAAARDLLPAGEVTAATWPAWTEAVKTATGRKGKALFMTLRKALTGREDGPEMAQILALIGRDRVLSRLSP
jgi:glutamyl-tRNA synthetase